MIRHPYFADLRTAEEEEGDKRATLRQRKQLQQTNSSSLPHLTSRQMKGTPEIKPVQLHARGKSPRKSGIANNSNVATLTRNTSLTRNNSVFDSNRTTTSSFPKSSNVTSDKFSVLNNNNNVGGKKFGQLGRSERIDHLPNI